MAAHRVSMAAAGLERLTMGLDLSVLFHVVDVRTNEVLLTTSSHHSAKLEAREYRPHAQIRPTFYLESTGEPVRQVQARRIIADATREAAS